MLLNNDQPHNTKSIDKDTDNNNKHIEYGQRQYNPTCSNEIVLCDNKIIRMLGCFFTDEQEIDNGFVTFIKHIHIKYPVMKSQQQHSQTLYYDDIK